MSDDLHNIDRLFKQGIEGEEDNPPPHLWNRISEELDGKKPPVRIRRFGAYLSGAAALLIIASVSLIYILGVHSESSPKQDVVKTSQSEDAPLRKKSENISHTNESIPSALQLSAPNLNDSTESIKEGNGSKKFQIPAQVVSKAKDNEPITNNSNIDLSATSLQKNEIAEPRELAGGQVNHTTNEPLPNFTYRPLATPLLPDKLSKEQNWMPATAPAYSMIAGSSKPSIQRYRPHSPFSLSLFYEPGFASVRLKDQNNDAPPPGRRRSDVEIREKEQYSTVVRTGILMDYRINRRWSVQSGIAFSSSTINIAPQTIYAQHDGSGNIRYRIECSSGYSYLPAKQGGALQAGDSTKALGSKNVLQYVMIPVSARYHLTSNRFTFSPALGISANFLTKGNIETTLNNTASNEKASNSKIEGLHATYFSGQVNFMTEYNLTQNLSVGLGPSANFAITSINKQTTTVRSYPNSFGATATVRISF